MGDNPVTLPSAITAAVIATINVLALIFTWDVAVVAGLNLAASAWIIVLAFFIRTKVTPTGTSKFLVAAAYAQGLEDK